MAANEHHHEHVHLDEADWAAWADQTELVAEVFPAFVSDTAEWVDALRGPDAPPVSRIIDIGSGPGVGTCQLARRFPDARVVAIDSSPAMLDRTAARAVAEGLDGRISTRLAELPGGLDGLDRADVIWASMSLHHVGDEVACLRVLRELLEPDGLIAIAELAEPMRVLPDSLELGTPGLGERLDQAGAGWYARMREGLADSVPSADLATMLAAAGFEVVDLRLASERLDPPLSDDGRRVALGHLRQVRHQLHEDLDGADLQALDVLTDEDDPAGVMHRPDVFVTASRQLVIARTKSGQ